MKGEIKEIVKGEKYFIRIFLGRDSTGKRSWYSEMFYGQKRLAENRKNDLVSLNNKGQLKKPERQAFIDYLKSWLGGSVIDTISRRTYSDYQSMIERYVEPNKIARVKLTELTPDHLEALYKEMRDRNLSVRTVRYLHNILKRALRQAERRGKVQRNVTNLVELPKQKQRRMPRSMDFTQVEKFLKAAAVDRFYSMWLLALDSGMRPEEYLGLEWGDIDFKTRVVKVQRVLCRNRKGGGYYFDDPKTEQSRRTIELAPSTIDAIKEHRFRQNEDKMRAGKEWKVILHEKRALHLVFTTHSGSPLLLSNLHRRHFKPILKSANLPAGIRIYDLRHTCATLLGVLNVRAKLIQERLGHSTIKTTLDLYSHVLKTEQSVASGKLEETIFSKLMVGS